MTWKFMVGDKVLYKDAFGKNKKGTVTGFDESMGNYPMIVEAEDGTTRYFMADGRKNRSDVEPMVIPDANART